MLELVKTYYNPMFKCYTEQYENTAYKVYFQFPVDENQNPVHIEDPCGLQTTGLRLVLVAPKDMVDGVKIQFRIVSRAVGKERNWANILYIPDGGESYYFCELHGATGKWADAARTLIELSELVEEKFPGYYITDKKDY